MSQHKSNPDQQAVGFDWNAMRFEAIATLALNGLLSNAGYNHLTADQIAAKAIELAKALETKFAVSPQPIE